MAGAHWEAALRAEAPKTENGMSANLEEPREEEVAGGRLCTGLWVKPGACSWDQEASVKPDSPEGACAGLVGA